MKTKICPKCQEEKSLEEYHKSNMTNDKRQAYCKICNKNCTSKERRVEFNKRRQERRKNEDYKQQEYRMGKQFRINNRERYLLKGIKKRCLEKNIPINITEVDIQIPDKCPVLGIPLTKGIMHHGDWGAPSVDRIIPNKGYIKGNVMVISRKANTMKNNASLEELEIFCKSFLKIIKSLKK